MNENMKAVFDLEGLEEKSNVQKTHVAGSDKPVKFYSLDVNLINRKNISGGGV